MNFSSMDYFVMVAQEQSFTRAAERLHITQQTLSAHIANLEKEVGGRLFVRTVPLTLTYAGQVFLEYAIDFRRRYQDLERTMGDISSSRKGLLRIGISAIRGRATMPALIHEFHQRNPQISVRLIEVANDQLIPSLMDGEIDLAVTDLSRAGPGLEVWDFYQEEIILAAARTLVERLYGSRAGLEERMEREGNAILEDFPFLLGSPHGVIGHFSRGFLAQAGIIPNVAAVSFNIETLLEMCVLGEGACFCSERLMRVALPQEKIDRLELFRLGEEARCMIRFACLKQKRRWSVLEDFIDVMLQNAV